MALRKHKPLPKFRAPPEPTIRLTLSEVKVLRACYMGDRVDALTMNNVAVKLNEFIEATQKGGDHRG